MSNIQSNEQRLNWLSQIEKLSYFEEINDFEASKVNGGRAEISQSSQFKLAYDMIPKFTEKSRVGSLPKQ